MIQAIDRVTKHEWMDFTKTILDLFADGKPLETRMQDAYDMLFDGSAEKLFHIYSRRCAYIISIMHAFLHDGHGIVRGVRLTAVAEHNDAVVPLSSADGDMPSTAARVMF